MREKLADFGGQNLTEVELLAIILGSGGRQSSVLQLARQVLQAFPLSELPQQNLKNFLTVPGIGVAKATQILAALEFGRRCALPPRAVVSSPAQVLMHVEHLRRLPREHTVCLYLNARHELLHTETVAVGGLNYSLLEPRDVFGPALRLPAASCIVVHNHPSGVAEPSPDDLTVTRRLQEAGRLLGVTLLDHIIVAKEEHTSLRELGYLEENSRESQH